MASCALHGELLEPFYQGSENPAWSYERTPARPAPSELLALDRLTLAVSAVSALETI